jgi:hypothetical protein
MTEGLSDRFVFQRNPLRFDLTRDAAREVFAETIDSIMTMDLMSKGIVSWMYGAARRIVGGPLAFNAARLLRETVRTASTPIFLTAGSMSHFLHIPETDGPIGTVVLCRALVIGLRAVPVVLVDRGDEEAMGSILRAASLVPVRHVDEARNVRNSVVVRGLPIVREEAQAAIQQLFAETEPVAVVAVERPGWNVKQQYHKAVGLNISAHTAPMDLVFADAKAKKAPTIGIGDYGNELGMGSLADTVRQQLPTGSHCQCPCNAGVAATTEADSLVVATTSNWGAYGCASCLAEMVGDADVFIDAEIGMRIISQAVSSGFVDGGSFKPRLPSGDGFPRNIDGSIVTLMRYALMSILDRSDSASLL